ncbi:hypothetical protein [Candidatus Halocynthiibacter alkanivorans]|uniref:hypothetical protein n=1 Tax=Candidatus Halocynthiibacter alkanivorans TaxID=2267619 RepID=UPI00109CFB3E|nr:hypothetical protein [Candidatus Halocynthiibacter alkanivorans]
MTRTGAKSGLILPLAVFAALASFLALWLLAAEQAGQGLGYTLDGSNTRLAPDEQTAGGGFAGDTGGSGLASSSPLYPLLMQLAPGAELQRLFPLIWNVIGLVLAAGVWGMLLLESGLAQAAPRASLALAALAPTALNMPGVALTGMEHTLHIAASLAIVLGLFRFVRSGHLEATLMLAILLAPLLRPEALAMVILSGIVVAALGHWKQALGLVSLGLLPLIGFAALGGATGLSVLPAWTRGNMTGDITAAGSGFDLIAANFVSNIRADAGQALLALSILAIVASSVLRVTGDKRRLVIVMGLFAGGTGLAQLLFGQSGWLNSSASYATSSVVATLLMLAGLTWDQAPRARSMLGAVGIVMALLSWDLSENLAETGIWLSLATTPPQQLSLEFPLDRVRDPMAKRGRVKAVDAADLPAFKTARVTWAAVGPEGLSVETVSEGQG